MGIIAGHHNDAFEVIGTFKKRFSEMKRCDLNYKGALFNADSSFDIRAARKTPWNYGVIPHVAENKRNRKTTVLCSR
jgi:hypothetical protein